MKLKIFLILILITSYMGAQSHKNEQLLEIFEKAQEVYKSKSSYFIEVQYKLFENYGDHSPLDTYKGKIAKKGDVYYNYTLGTEILSSPNITIKASHDQKAIEISRQENLENNFFNVKRFLEFFTDFDIQEDEGVIRCELLAPKITPLPYGKIILFIDSETYLIKKQVMYYVQSSQYKDKEGNWVESFPKLEISFSEIKPVNLIQNEVFKENYYISKNNGMILPSKKFNDFQIVSGSENSN